MFLGQVNLETFALNIMLIIAVMLLVGAGVFSLTAAYTITRAVWWHLAQRRSWKAYNRAARREDGQRFPPCMEGFCDQCRLSGTRIYHTAEGPMLCPECYEVFWRDPAAWMAWHNQTKLARGSLSDEESTRAARPTTEPTARGPKEPGPRVTRASELQLPATGRSRGAAATASESKPTPKRLRESERSRSR